MVSSPDIAAWVKAELLRLREELAALESNPELNEFAIEAHKEMVATLEALRARHEKT